MSTDFGNFSRNRGGAPYVGKILNRYESRALKILQSTVSRYGMVAHAKIRIADTLPINDSGISDKLYLYALTAHFDFLIALNDKPVMAVELDGSGHHGSQTINHDRLKNQICSYFNLPILRADTQYLRTIGQSTILEYLVEETVKRVTVQSGHHGPVYHFDSSMNVSKVADYMLPYDVKQIAISPMAFLRSLSICNLNHDSRVHAGDDVLCATQLVKSKDNFFTAAAFTILDDDTAILGTGSFFADSLSPLDAPFLAVGLALIDTLDLLRMFDQGRYRGIAIGDAIEYLSHFSQYASEEGCGRFLSTNPLCHQLTEDWLVAAPEKGK